MGSFSSFMYFSADIIWTRMEWASFSDTTLTMDRWDSRSRPPTNSSTVQNEVWSNSKTSNNLTTLGWSKDYNFDCRFNLYFVNNVIPCEYGILEDCAWCTIFFVRHSTIKNETFTIQVSYSNQPDQTESEFLYGWVMIFSMYVLLAGHILKLEQIKCLENFWKPTFSD